MVTNGAPATGAEGWLEEKTKTGEVGKNSRRKANTKQQKAGDQSYPNHAER